MSFSYIMLILSDFSTQLTARGGTGIEICQHDTERPLDLIHLPRCVLAYSAAVMFRVNKMVTQLLRIVDDTAVKLGAVTTTQYLNQSLEGDELGSSVTHLHNALELLYREPSQDLVRPLRLAMAGVLDAMLFWLISQADFLDFVRKRWSHLLPKIATDQAEYRRICSWRMGSGDDRIKALLTEAPGEDGGRGRIAERASSANTQSNGC